MKDNSGKLFKNVKSGDKVLVSGRVGSINNPMSKHFWIPIEVKKVTDTQFTTLDGRRWTKNGDRVGGNYTKAYPINNNMGIKDDTKKYREYLNLLDLRNSAYSKHLIISKKYLPMDPENLRKIINLLDQIINLM